MVTVPRHYLLSPTFQSHGDRPPRSARNSATLAAGAATADYKKIFLSTLVDYQRLTKDVLRGNSPRRPASVIVTVFVTNALPAVYANAGFPIPLPIG
jgi:hypothetical protein